MFPISKQVPTVRSMQTCCVLLQATWAHCGRTMATHLALISAAKRIETFPWFCDLVCNFILLVCCVATGSCLDLNSATASYVHVLLQLLLSLCSVETVLIFKDLPTGLYWSDATIRLCFSWCIHIVHTHLKRTCLFGTFLVFRPL